MASVSTATHQGSRYHQEDRAVVLEGINPSWGQLLLVADGHSGSECADEVVRATSSMWEPLFNTFPRISPLNRINCLFRALDEATRRCSSGAAVSVVFIPRSQHFAYVGVLGDAPVFIWTKSSKLWHAPEHNVRSNPAEAKAAEERGGHVWLGYLQYGEYGLQMSRALGDWNMRSVLLQAPECFRVPIGPDSFVLVGSDGVLDPGHRSIATNGQPIIDMIIAGGTADDIVNRAVGIPTRDNATAILWRASRI
jgi:serine/threonine protein phosphatase PrpC